MFLVLVRFRPPRAFWTLLKVFFVGLFVVVLFYTLYVVITLPERTTPAHAYTARTH